MAIMDKTLETLAPVLLHAIDFKATREPAIARIISVFDNQDLINGSIVLDQLTENIESVPKRP